MTQDSAYAITRRLLDGYGELRNKDEDRIHDAAFYLAFELIPDEALAGRAEMSGHSEPVIAALDRQQLYVLSVGPLNDGDPATGSVRLIYVAPDTGKVELEAQYMSANQRSRERPPRIATWRFTFGDVALAFKTDREIDGEITGEWKLAVKLAEALGWKIQPPQ